MTDYPKWKRIWAKSVELSDYLPAYLKFNVALQGSSYVPERWEDRLACGDVPTTPCISITPMTWEEWYSQDFFNEKEMDAEICKLRSQRPDPTNSPS